MPPRGYRKPAADRVWPKIAKAGPDECWLWTGSRSPYGYGTVSGKSGRGLAHRLVYALTNGPIPPGMFICHHCDNPPCCNPAHLFMGTPQDNHADMDRKGRRVMPRTSGTLNHNARITEDDVVAIRTAFYAGATRPQLAAKYRVHRGTIERALNGRLWSHVTTPPPVTMYAAAAVRTHCKRGHALSDDNVAWETRGGRRRSRRCRTCMCDGARRRYHAIRSLPTKEET